MYFYTSSCLTINDKRIFFMLAISSLYNLWRVLASIYCIFIPSSMFYPLVRVLSPHPCFIRLSVFYPLIHVLSSHPCFIPTSVPYPRHPYPYPCFIPSFSIPCNAELKARLILSVDRDASFCGVSAASL